jgi:tetratricopeptide (TPR) repeat protein
MKFKRVSLIVLLAILSNAITIYAQNDAPLNRIEEKIKQLKADLGWLYLQSGNYKNGISLLTDAPLPPSTTTAKFLPYALDSIERRRLYIGAMDSFCSELDATKLTLGHIFFFHLATERLADQELAAPIISLAHKTKCPVAFEALSNLLFTPDGEKDYQAIAQYIEMSLQRIEDLRLEPKDAVHFSHYYYNAACAHSRTQNYQLAIQRLRKAFSISTEESSYSLEDPELENLRNFLGIEEFKKLVKFAPDNDQVNTPPA